MHEGAACGSLGVTWRNGLTGRRFGRLVDLRDGAGGNVMATLSAPRSAAEAEHEPAQIDRRYPPVDSALNRSAKRSLESD